MRYSLLNKITVIFLISFLVGISGCGSILDNIPAPPNLMVNIELTNNYDKDIPTKFVKQLKWASFISDWAIPYIFINVGQHFESAGDEQRAFYYYDRAIAEVQKRKDAYGEGTATSRKILALYKFGKSEDAYNAIKEMERQWTAAPLNSFIFQNYGHYCLMNGDYERAMEYFRQFFESNQNYQDNFNLLMMRRDSELEYGIAVILADYYKVMSRKLNLHDFDEAQYKLIVKNIDEGIFHLKQVIVLDKEIRKTKIDRFTSNTVFQIIESKAYIFSALAYGIKGQYAEAFKNIDTSGKLADKAGFKVGKINNILFRSQLYLLERNISAAEESAIELNDIADKYHLPFYWIWAKFIQSICCQELGNVPKAINLLKDATALMEKQREELVMEILKDTYTYDRRLFYEALIGQLADEGDHRGALETAERAKALVLVDLLAGKNLGKNRTETELIKQNNNYINQIADGYRKVLKDEGEDHLTLKNTLDKIGKAENAHLDTINKIKAQNEELYSLISVEPVNADDIRQLLDKNTTIFSYYITDQILFIWTINKDKVHLEKVKISKDDVARLVFSFNDSIVAKEYNKTESLSEKVYNNFLKPVMPFVSGDRIGIIPHGALYYLPFAAISYRGQYLVDAFSIFHFPSADALKYVLKKQPANNLNILAFISPEFKNKKLDSSYSETELESVQNIIPQANIFLKVEATEAKVKAMIGNYDLVHFATRSVFVEESPLNSYLLLVSTRQDDGRLTTAEIFKLEFRGRAVVMSACTTAPRIYSGGAEIVGLNRAFLYAGSPSVVSTFWNIEEKPKATFMDLFYINLGKNESIADSLRITQNEMIRLGYRPFDWAGFILNGKY
jgi:CHAT domain-containing protein